MKKIFCILLVSTNIFLFSCGSNSKKTLRNNSFNIDPFDNNSFYFTTNNYDLNDNNSILYKLNLEKKTPKLQLERSDSSDTILFQEINEKGQISSLIFTERFIEKQSRISKAFPDGLGYERATNTPINVHDISLNTDSKHLKYSLLGYNDSNISELSNMTDLAIEPTKINFNSLRKNTANTPTAMLQKNNLEFILTFGGGQNRYYNETEIATIFVTEKLNHNVTNKYVISTKEENDTYYCRNIYDTLKISASRIIISCNPEYFASNKTNSTPLLVYLIDINDVKDTSTAPKINLIYKTFSKSENNTFDLNTPQAVKIGGFINRTNQLFLSENHSSDFKSFTNPKIGKTHWFKINDDDTTNEIDPKTDEFLKNISNVGNNMYVVPNFPNQYIWDCSVDPETKQCKNKKLSYFNGNTMEEISLEGIKSYNNIVFPKTIC